MTTKLKNIKITCTECYFSRCLLMLDNKRRQELMWCPYCQKYTITLKDIVPNKENTL